MTHALGDSHWVDVPTRPLVLVPIGSTEQHGPHLPMATDALIATAVAMAAVPLVSEAVDGDVMVAPVVAFGASGEHQGFPGTVSIGHEALRSLLIEMVRSLSSWAGRVVFVSGHGGNATTLVSVVEQMRSEGHRVSAVACAPETPKDAHAGYDETSVMLHLHPDLVDMTRARPGNVAPLSEILPVLMAEGLRPVTANGILGDPTEASAEVGRVVFDELVDRLVREVNRDG